MTSVFRMSRIVSAVFVHREASAEKARAARLSGNLGRLMGALGLEWNQGRSASFVAADVQVDRAAPVAFEGFQLHVGARHHWKKGVGVTHSTRGSNLLNPFGRDQHGLFKQKATVLLIQLVTNISLFFQSRVKDASLLLEVNYRDGARDACGKQNNNDRRQRFSMLLALPVRTLSERASRPCLF